MQKNRSGQYVYFTLVSALSGSPLEGLSGRISGRKSLDGLSGMIVLSGFVIELGGGSYRANLFDFDTNGDQVGYLFTGASAAVPVQYQFDMIDGNCSGRVWPASGVNATVPIASLSGVIANSGIFASVPIATLSGVVANSGLNVNADVIRWRNVTPNVLLASGRLDAAFNVRTNVGRSGTTTTIQLDAGAPTGTSGIYDGDLITIIGGSGQGETRIVRFYDSSGNVTVDRAWTVAAFADSIFTITPDANAQSGSTFVASGPFVNVPIASISGAVGNSGLFVSVLPANLSGVVANSGLFVSVPIATLSGVIANSGIFATVPIATISGNVGNSGLNVNANVVRWLTVAPNALVSSGRVDAAFGVAHGLARSGTTSTVQLAAGTPEGTSGVYDGQLINLVGGTGAGQTRVIANYGSSGILFTNAPWTTAPDDTSVYCITPASQLSGRTNLASGSINSGVINSGVFVTATATVDPALISGLFVTVPKATISGVVANSGLFVVANATVDPALISGLFVTVPIATISGTIVNSGLFVTVPKATISGVVANSGLNVDANVVRYGGTAGTFNGGIPGVNVVEISQDNTAADNMEAYFDGTGYGQLLQRGLITNLSSQTVFDLTVGSDDNDAYNGCVIVIEDSTTPAQKCVGVVLDYVGATKTVTLLADPAVFTIANNDRISLIADRSLKATVPTRTLDVQAAGALGSIGSGILSGQQLTARTVSDKSGYTADTLSGTTFIASGPFVNLPKATISGVVANSGLFVNATATVDPTTISGVFVNLPKETISGVVANSGLFVSVLPANLSGVIANSGLFVTLPKATISGVVANSGLFVTATASVDPATISGVFATVPKETISGVVANSGLFTTVLPANLSGVVANSGLSVIGTVYSGQMSGQQINLLSGNQVQVWSGTQVNTFSGQQYPNSGLPGRILSYDFSGQVVASGTRCLLNAERKLINKWSLATVSGYLLVYEEDDSTVAYRQAVTIASGAQPLSALDT